MQGFKTKVIKRPSQVLQVKSGFCFSNIPALDPQEKFRKPGFERLTIIIFVSMPQDTHKGDGGFSLPRHVYY